MHDVKVLLIDPDIVIRRVLRTCLEVDGLKAVEAENVASARAMIHGERFSLITLDIELGDEDGASVGREIRGMQDSPIMVVSGRSDSATRHAALMDFADDYIVKPFDVHEFIARSHALLRRSNGAARHRNIEVNARASQPGGETSIHFNGFTVDLAGHRVLDPDGRPVQLSATEFNTLRAFVTNANRVLSREHLLELSGGASPTEPLDRAIDMRVRRLRQKLGPPHASKLIRTVRGVGYIFTRDANPN